MEWMHLAKERAKWWDLVKSGDESAVFIKGRETICPTKGVILSIERISLKNVLRKLIDNSSLGAIGRWKCGWSWRRKIWSFKSSKTTHKGLA